MAITKRILKGFKGVDNIYTQHSPLVKQLVEQLIKGKLKETSYPFVGNSIKDRLNQCLLAFYIMLSQTRLFFLNRPQEIIVFSIGGITYEEALAIHNINKAYAGNIKVVIGGTCVHNFKR